MGKTEILEALQSHYNLPKDVDFANKLGVSSQVLYNWKKRNTYDAKLIYTNCLEINPEWLLTGVGDMLKTETKVIAMVPDVDINQEKITFLQEKVLLLQENGVLKDKVIALNDKVIDGLEFKVNTLEKQLIQDKSTTIVSTAKSKQLVGATV